MGARPGSARARARGASVLPPKGPRAPAGHAGRGAPGPGGAQRVRLAPGVCSSSPTPRLGVLAGVPAGARELCQRPGPRQGGPRVRQLRGGCPGQRVGHGQPGVHGERQGAGAAAALAGSERRFLSAGGQDLSLGEGGSHQVHPATRGAHRGPTGSRRREEAAVLTRRHPSLAVPSESGFCCRRSRTPAPSPPGRGARAVRAGGALSLPRPEGPGQPPPAPRASPRPPTRCLSSLLPHV